jgi:iron complex outermembrane receptor protein
MAVALLASVFAVGAFAADEDENKKEDEAIDMPEVVVAGSKLDGSAEAGYRVEKAKQVGPWGEQSLQDTPYSMTVISEEFIQNTINGSADHLWDLMPNVYMGRTGDYSRGFSGSVNPTSRGLGMTSLVNGVRMVNGTGGYFLEEMESVELTSGLTGFLYGGGYIGGSLNFVTKRPTPQRRTSVTLANTGGNNYTTHIDTSGPIWEGKFGYRVNFLYGDGETAIKDVRPGKRMVSGAFDWHATKNLYLEFEATHHSYDRYGQTTDFSNSPDDIIKDPINPHYSYMPDWAHSKWSTNKLGVNLEWKANDWFSLRSSWHRESSNSDYKMADPDRPDAEGNYNLGLDWWKGRGKQQGAYLYADILFNTYGVKHSVTGGTSYNEQTSRMPNPWYMWIGYIGTANFFDIGSWNLVSQPDYSNTTPFSKEYNLRTRSRNLNFAIGDDINFSDKYRLMLGWVYTHIYSKSFGWGTGEFSGRPNDIYSEGKNAYTASFIYKPVKSWDLYATAIQATEVGTYVGYDANPRYRNEGEYLPPTTSTQYEFGAKHDLKGILLSAAFFYIDQANFFDIPYDDGTRTRTQDGRQHRRGIEVSATGNVGDRLTVVGGFTLFDAKLVKTNNDTQRDKNPGNVPMVSFKTYLEYQMPFLKGLYATGDLRYTGKMHYGNLAYYDQMMPSFTVGEIGARYSRKISGIDTTFRVNVQNFWDAWYWRSSNWGMLGDPRAVTFSVTTAF